LSNSEDRDGVSKNAEVSSKHIWETSGMTFGDGVDGIAIDGVSIGLEAGLEVATGVMEIKDGTGVIKFGKRVGAGTTVGKEKGAKPVGDGGLVGGLCTGKEVGFDWRVGVGGCK
jgi:hypothetical protein